MSARLGSSELAVFEAFVRNARRGLKQPQIADASGVPRMTVRRIMERFEKKGIVVNMGKEPGNKALLYKLNAADPEVVEMGRAVLEYTVRINKLETTRQKRVAQNNNETILFESHKTPFPNPAVSRRIGHLQSTSWPE
jgi:DNA-binding Lrp family transcriptional regulator